MPLTKPPLTKVAPGLPITAGGWNAVLDSIGGLYDGLNQASSDYIDIGVAFRGRGVDDARVIGIPVDGNGKPMGPALSAVPPDGLRMTYHLVGIAPGTWNIGIAAPGFTPAMASVQVGVLATSGPSASTQVELKRTTVPVPDLVGLTYQAVGFFLHWAGLPRGIETSEDTGQNRNPYIVMQGPSGGEVPHGTPINLWWATGEVPLTGRKPSRTVVPDLLGLPGDYAYAHATAYFLFTRGQESGTGTGLRVAEQDPLPGQFVAPGMALNVRYIPTDPNVKTNFEVYPATHAALAKIPVVDVLTALNASTDLAFLGVQDILFAPWDIVRTYLTDDALKTILDFFGRFKVSVSDPSKDLPAIWESLIVAYHLGRA